MDRTGGSSGGRPNNNTNNNSKNSHNLGINRQSSKIGKPIKRPSSSVIQQQQQANNKQPPPPPVYNINKKDFRDVVQRLTGSPLPEPYQPPPPPPPPPPSAAPPKPPNSRLQKIRPPPLNALNPAPFHRGGAAAAAAGGALMNSPYFSPLPPLTPGDAVWANGAIESPVTLYMRYLQQPMPNPLPSRPPHVAGSPGGSQRPPLHYPSPRQPPLLPSPTAQFLLPSPLPSPGSFMPLPSPGSFPPLPSPGSFLLPSPGSYMPLPLPSPGSMNFYSQSPSGHFGFPGGAPPFPPSPSLTFPPLSPAGRFPALSPRWREPSTGDFSFPDRDRRT